MTRQATLSHQDIARAKDILRNNDPRFLPPGTNQTLDIGHHDLDLAANYLLQKLARAMRAWICRPICCTFRSRCICHTCHGAITLIWMPVSPLPVDARRSPACRSAYCIFPPHWRSFCCGRRPDWSTMSLVDSAMALLRDLRILPDRLRLTYQWTPTMLEQARDSLLTHSDRESLRFYHDRLINCSRKASGVAARSPNC